MQFEPGEINIICTDLDASLTFYRDILGFISTTDDDGFYHLLCGDRQYLLLPIASAAMPFGEYTTSSQFSMDLVVADLKATYDYLKHHNVHIAMDYQEGKRNFVICDPDGLHWEIIEAI